MAKQNSWGFTNVSDSTHKLTPKLLAMTSNYAVSTEKADESVLNNKTCPIDKEEIISFRSRDINVVNTSLNIQYPSPVKRGIQYQISEEAVYSTTDSTDPSFRIDEPVVATLTIRHHKSGEITNEVVGTAVMRLLSACVKADGSWRFDDLMRAAERPVVD